ncbi:MAG: hypothetical protein ACRED5_12240 [Propylenella sp.]
MTDLVLLHMLVVGSTVNLLATILALLLFVAGVPIAVGVFVFLAPLPFNVFLVASVWRGSEGKPLHWAWFARAVSVAWLIAATLL